MDPEDFRYRVADDGRIAIAGLTLEETLELEALLRWQDVARDLTRELRLLELYLRHHATFTDRRRIIDAGSSESLHARRPRDVSSNGPRRARRMAGMSPRIQALRSALAIGMVSVGMLTVYLVVVSP
ncbi:hypothetical protein JQ629_30325 [Bradyrhizobium sp. AUGA SZCCT0222]|uniref:hypothetical protein n=1 Tax=Bradyrhizobium sp. AUGA SZCCT0222 TaxID=2807668 RepID=UPI001BA500C4|nr:hypothetical protein [Bradyrhizobium sp. AUGA SZCCT0222]MBR1271789.1 hypothetical protein [Bradyrhizobium sp. AUGA SZCCT0222]